MGCWGSGWQVKKFTGKSQPSLVMVRRVVWKIEIEGFSWLEYLPKAYRFKGFYPLIKGS